MLGRRGKPGALGWPAMPRPRSVRAKFLLINVPLVVIASLIAFSVFEYYNYRQQMADLAEKKTRLLQSQVEILAPALWAQERPRVQHILSVLVTDPDVVGARVHHTDGRLYGAVGASPKTAGETGALVGTQPIFYFTDASYHRIGRLRLAMTDRRALAHLYRSTVLAAAMTGALVLAAIASALVAYWRTIGIPLTRLQRAIDSGRSQGGQVRPRVDWASADEMGAVVRAYNDLQDIQERNEAQLRAAWDEAETAKVRAQSATRAKSAFLANMSHEIRTPMNAVLGFADLLRHRDLSAREHEYVEMIHASGSNLLGILNDILDFSKIEAGRMELAEAPFEMETVLSHVAAVTALGAEDKGLDLFLRIGSAVPRQLYGDATRLEQMLVNLVNNAVKFTETGHARVDVDGLAAEAGRVRIRMAVTDTGVGMDRAQQDGLFQPFAQADGTTTRNHGGTGLGLAIVGKLTELMGGTIEVDSAPGAGSTFTVTLPLRAAGADAAASATDLTGMAILVVPGHPVCGEVIGEILGARHAMVRACANAQSARAALAAGGYDLVLLDWDAVDPARTDDGAAALAAAGRGDAGAIVMASTRTRDSAMACAETYGITRSLAKPVMETPLLTAVTEATGTATADAAGASPGAAAAGAFHGRALAGALILLAEDNAGNQAVTTDILESAGARVVLAETGAAAVEHVEHAAGACIDAVLMDVEMPDLDGCAAAERIRALEANGARGRVPIIAMTAHAMTAWRESCLAAGMDDHVAKPLDPETLVRTVAAWLPGAARAPVQHAQRG